MNFGKFLAHTDKLVSELTRPHCKAVETEKRPAKGGAGSWLQEAEAMAGETSRAGKALCRHIRAFSLPYPDRKAGVHESLEGVVFRRMDGRQKACPAGPGSGGLDSTSRPGENHGVLFFGARVLHASPNQTPKS